MYYTTKSEDFPRRLRGFHPDGETAFNNDTYYKKSFVERHYDESKAKWEKARSENKALLEAKLAEQGLEGEVEMNGAKEAVVTVYLRDGEFVFEARNDRGRYPNLSVNYALEWIKEFDPEQIRDTYAYEKAFTAWKNKNLPKL